MKKKTEKIEKEKVSTPSVSTESVVSEKEKLLALYKTLKDLGINSIGDLEGKIARAE